MSNAITMPLALVEGAQLARIVEDFLELLDAGDAPADPAFSRLAPDVYPEDAAASAAFAESTRSDLLGRRRTEADTVLSALTPFQVDLASLNEQDAFVTSEVSIPEADVDAWLRTLTALRLVLATRLGIVDEDEDRDPEDARYGVYDWLGYRLEVLIEAADELIP